MRSGRNTARDLGTHQAMLGQKEIQNQPFFGMLGRLSRHGYVSAHAVAVDGYIYLPIFFLGNARLSDCLIRPISACQPNFLPPLESSRRFHIVWSTTSAFFLEAVRQIILSPLKWCNTMYSLT
jgi:hypothetical protein